MWRNRERNSKDRRVTRRYGSNSVVLMQERTLPVRYTIKQTMRASEYSTVVEIYFNLFVYFFLRLGYHHLWLEREGEVLESSRPVILSTYQGEPAIL